MRILDLSGIEKVVLAICIITGLLHAPSFLRANPEMAPLLTERFFEDATTTYMIGLHYFGDGAYDIGKAKRYFEETLKRDEEYPWAHYQLGRVHFIENNMGAALSEFNAELANYPLHDRIFYMRGLVLGYSGLLTDAAADFREFIARKPAGWAAYNDLAWVYFRMGKFQETLDTAKRGLAYSPDNPWLLNMAGAAALNLGSFKEAHVYLEHARAIAERLTPKDWGNAYPGNDPQSYAEGLTAMRASIDKNLSLLGEDK